MTTPSILYDPIEFLPGVGPTRAEVLGKELGIKRLHDLLFYYPFRYEDRSIIYTISDIHQKDINIQLVGQITELKTEGAGRKKRLKAFFEDKTGTIELVWFKGADYIAKNLKTGVPYKIYGRVGKFGSRYSIAHPEMSLVVTSDKVATGLQPVYSSTELAIKRGLDSKSIAKISKSLLKKLKSIAIPENLPDYLIQQFNLLSRKDALFAIHHPSNETQLRKAKARIKFEELFYLQLEILFVKSKRQARLKGHKFDQVGNYFNTFYSEHLPFTLTEAQKRVIKEIRFDLGSGVQMNRLLQGDVGSGKTVVSLMCMLLAIDNGFQACLLAPTEILAQQHHQSLIHMTHGLDIDIAFLSGSIKGKARRIIFEDLARGQIKIIVGTHALLEDPVQYHNLGIAITDEQHRFGVGQRSKLWKKRKDDIAPHVLVMTATPIPRTLAMTFYGDLDVSVIDELPPGRKPIKTKHIYDSRRPQLHDLMEQEIKKGRQIYVVYPLIEESAKLDLQNLQDGYTELLSRFPRPDYQISVVHGRMKAEDKEAEMQRFKSGKTQILVGTTVIEVGVDVPNASVMIIENAERFGLSQLHQLRGRVGRGGEQSFCFLMSSFKLSKEAKRRLQTMEQTNDGFKIAEVDLDMRGPGDIQGTRQSGELPLSLANLQEDGALLSTARNIAADVLAADPELSDEKNQILQKHLSKKGNQLLEWSRIS